ncbi:carbohydrate ABC transporter membrane protein 1 (CUT1 family) [Salana multivorans]|uniref:Carbohydrate ABC transporter membrane protein 1 (CUT1 family) n=1 Tax=Salana multivorans TaxID=120377 RepID=A0A3N2D998_9MICO|nr:sugar ABC transporter permease [Salana multivorans]MBN8881799.1 sugar ABC transporter permease [Salana multivorans]ROR96365.1 carbohydrate ABC transporter membrane protein 1 (CUT1 family) [Salana multivorans]
MTQSDGLPAPGRPLAGGARRAPRRPHLSARTRVGVAATGFLLPAVALLVVLRVVPLVRAGSDAFTSRSGALTLTVFENLFGDPDFLNTLKVTLLFSLIVNPFQIGLALLLAVVLVQHIPLVGVWRALILLPIAIPQTVSAIVWGVLMRPDGPLNAILGAVGIEPVPWLISPDLALFSIVIVASWVGVGYWMTFLVAGIKDIPPSLFEAAELDGATGVQRFFRITLPSIRRQLLFVLVADSVANFLLFVPVRILTRGGPQGSTNTIMNNIFERAYLFGNYPSAAAATLVLIVIVIAVVGLQFRLLPGRE